jgi:hypothetical protein
VTTRTRPVSGAVPEPSARRAVRRRWWLLPVLAALALVLISPHVGRAEPTGNYRPLLPADALANGCYPLPAGMTIDFPYQVRSDGDVDGPGGRHRRLVLQYDEIDRATAQQRITAALQRAGLPVASATVTAYPRVPADSIVRGEIELSLPVVAQQTDVPDPDQCANPFSTKRFPPDWPSSTSYA